MANVYHFSLGFVWPTDPNQTTGTLNTACVLYSGTVGSGTAAVTAPPTTLLPALPNQNPDPGTTYAWQDLVGGDQIWVYLYDQTNAISPSNPNASGASPAALANNWFNYTPEIANDSLFTSTGGFPSTAAFTFVGAAQSVAFGNNYACWLLSTSSTTQNPAWGTVADADAGQDSDFAVTVTVSLTKGSQTVAFTSDPEMSVTSGSGNWHRHK